MKGSKTGSNILGAAFLTELEMESVSTRKCIERIHETLYMASRVSRKKP